MILGGAILCLALNVYYEARGEPLAGQVAVAQVTMRRAGYDQDRVCPEVLRPAQFSWTAERTVRHGRKAWVLKRGHWPAEYKAWRQAWTVAEDVMANRYVTDYSGGATHFHTKAVSPSWARRMDRVAEIGNHKFYRG